MKTIYGSIIDPQTRCQHYHTEKDIVAIKFKCCEKYYPCFQCHAEGEDHDVRLWKQEEFDQPAILCGVCKYEHTIRQYIDTDHCVNCRSPFNEGCQKHYHLYFEYDKEKQHGWKCK